MSEGVCRGGVEACGEGKCVGKGGGVEACGE